MRNMMENNRILATPTNDEETVLSLPIKKKELGEFISSLLGQQQSIERNLNVKFDIDHAWLMNLHEMISQRIYQQADAHLTYFSSVIYFTGGVKRTFTSAEAFETYSENKKLLPIGIKIIWIYLIQFPLKKHPEKQQITFSAKTGHRKNLRLSTSFIYILFDAIFYSTLNESELNYQIDHTERTWGDDIEVIIANQVNSVVRNDCIKNRIFNFLRVSVSLLIAVYSVFYINYTEILNDITFSSKATSEYSKLQNINIEDFAVINKKIDYIAGVIISIKAIPEVKRVIFMVIGLFAALFIFIVTRRDTYSFLVLSKEAEKYREEKLQLENRSILILVASFLISVISGIIGNYGFAWLTR